MINPAETPSPKMKYFAATVAVLNVIYAYTNQLWNVMLWVIANPAFMGLSSEDRLDGLQNHPPQQDQIWKVIGTSLQMYSVFLT